MTFRDNQRLEVAFNGLRGEAEHGGQAEVTAEDFDHVLGSCVDDPREGDDEAGTPDPGLVMSYAANMTVESLVERLDGGDIFIPSVGSGCVWSMARASRLVESLLLGLPVPNIYLFREHESGRHMVLDGRQRLLAMEGFLHGSLCGSDFRLTGVCEGLMGKSYADMHRLEQRQLDKVLITVTVVHQPKSEVSRSPVLSVFERLNKGTGGLSSHEMRAAVYEGSLNRVLSELSASPCWQEVYGRENDRNGQSGADPSVSRAVLVAFGLQTADEALSRHLHGRTSGPRSPDGTPVPEVLRQERRHRRRSA